jgi:glycerol uptake facilitator-like aquaporin
MIFSFSGISGAVFNPAIAFALWLTGKLSNRYFCSLTF